MTTTTEFRAALTEISTVLGNVVTASQSSEQPYAALVAHLDQVRTFVDQMASNVTDPKVRPNAEALPEVSKLECFGCVAARAQAEAQGTPADKLPEINPAVFVVQGTSMGRCHVQLTSGPVIPGRTPGGIILGGG